MSETQIFPSEEIAERKMLDTFCTADVWDLALGCLGLFPDQIFHAHDWRVTMKSFDTVTNCPRSPAIWHISSKISGVTAM
jgi:hypothetical protein